MIDYECEEQIRLWRKSHHILMQLLVFIAILCEDHYCRGLAQSQMHRLLLRSQDNWTFHAHLAHPLSDV